MKPSQPIRESLTTINEDGSRNFLHPADVSGRFTLWRRAAAFLLVLFYLLLPWIPVNGHPAVFLDVASRRFHLFGFTLAAQDLWVVFFGITGLGFALFMITSLFGRVWCGWACPQTVFMEHVFRRIERLLEGDHNQQRRLDALPWSDSDKLYRRGGKFVLFGLICLVLTHLFLAYFVSLPELYRYMTHSPFEHWSAFVFVFVATALLFVNFTWFREQLCIVICPYGRIQSALIDDDSLVVGYDEKRGEPRGPAKDPERGHCVNCNRCVAVCPTGIDIRQGLQMECIGCANCIDACDSIMEKLNRPRGLIRYDSANGFEGRRKALIRPRLFLYAGLLVLGLSVMVYSLGKIQPAFATVSRMAASPYVIDKERLEIRNQFNIRLINKEVTPMTLKVGLEGVTQPLQVVGMDTELELQPMEEFVRPFVLILAIQDFGGNFNFNVRVTSADGRVDLLMPTDFVGPDAERLKSRYLN